MQPQGQRHATVRTRDPCKGLASAILVWYCGNTRAVRYTQTNIHDVRKPASDRLLSLPSTFK